MEGRARQVTGPWVPGDIGVHYDFEDPCGNLLVRFQDLAIRDP